MKKWTKKRGIIKFSLKSDGRTGREWIARLESKGIHVEDTAKRVLRSKGFKPTAASTSYKVTILKSELFSDSELTTGNVYKLAEKYKLSSAHAEIACLIRDKFSDSELRDMGLEWVIVMHKPIKDKEGKAKILFVYHTDDEGPWLNAFEDHPGVWRQGCGFAFISP